MFVCFVLFCFVLFCLDLFVCLCVCLFVCLFLFVYLFVLFCFVLFCFVLFCLRGGVYSELGMFVLFVGLFAVFILNWGFRAGVAIER